MPPDAIHWPDSEFALKSNETINIPVNNDGPNIDTWEAYPSLPEGISLLNNGTISGTPTERDQIGNSILSGPIIQVDQSG